MAKAGCVGRKLMWAAGLGQLEVSGVLRYALASGVVECNIELDLRHADTTPER